MTGSTGPGPGIGRGSPSDWVSGERVFAPPRGTVDVDWLVPAVLELAPGARPDQARAALERAWLARRGRPGGPDPAATADTAGPDHPVAVAAARVLDEALRVFGD